jgi:uncharacterized protein (DUF433 family)
MERRYVEQRDGGYWIRGSRVSVDSVVLAFRDGLSPEAIATECFPTLSLEQVYGVITYYLGHRGELDAYLNEAEGEHSALRERTRNAQPDFVAKLVQARRSPSAHRS